MNGTSTCNKSRLWAHLQCVGALLLEFSVELLAALVQRPLQSLELCIQRLLVLATVLLQRQHTHTHSVAECNNTENVFFSAIQLINY